MFSHSQHSFVLELIVTHNPVISMTFRWSNRVKLEDSTGVLPLSTNKRATYKMMSLVMVDQIFAMEQFIEPERFCDERGGPGSQSSFPDIFHLEFCSLPNGNCSFPTEMTIIPLHD